MSDFSSEEIETIDRLWRRCPIDHVWAGWAIAGGQKKQVWIFRKRANWRRFTLEKGNTAYQLFDEKNRRVAIGKTLEDLMAKVDSIPGINETISLN